MTTGSARLTSVSGADHCVSDWDRNDLLVLGFADFAVDNRHDSLLKDAGHTSWMAGLTPSCDVAFGPNWRVRLWQADWGDISVELDRLFQFEHSNIIVHSTAVPPRVNDDAFHFVFSCEWFPLGFIVSSDSDGELSRSIDIPVHTMGSGNNGLR